MKDEIRVVFHDLVHDVGVSAQGCFAYLFAGVLGYITQAEQEYMAGVDMRDADAGEGVARAIHLPRYAKELGEHCDIIIKVTNGAISRHSDIIKRYHEEIGVYLLSDGFEDRSRACLVINMKVAEETLGKHPIVLFQMPPIEA